jgi:hypothetical protein
MKSEVSGVNIALYEYIWVLFPQPTSLLWKSVDFCAPRHVLRALGEPQFTPPT